MRLEGQLRGSEDLLFLQRKVLCTLVLFNNDLQLQFRLLEAFSGPWGHYAYRWYTYTHAGKHSCTSNKIHIFKNYNTHQLTEHAVTYQNLLSFPLVHANLFLILTQIQSPFSTHRYKNSSTHTHKKWIKDSVMKGVSSWQQSQKCTFAYLQECAFKERSRKAESKHSEMTSHIT